MPYVHVDYEEFDVSTYSGIEVYVDEEIILKINSGNFDQDLEDIENYISHRINSNGEYIEMSSLTDFFMDRVDDEA